MELPDRLFKEASPYASSLRLYEDKPGLLLGGISPSRIGEFEGCKLLALSSILWFVMRFLELAAAFECLVQNVTLPIPISGTNENSEKCEQKACKNAAARRLTTYPFPRQAENAGSRFDLTKLHH